MVASLVWWSGWDEATQNCALQATAEAGKAQREAVLASDEELRPKMEAEGAVFAEADKAAYQAATASVYDKYAKTYPDLVAALKKAAGIK